MAKLKFGDRVLIDHKLERKEKFDSENQNRWIKKWEPVPFSGTFKEGIYLGDRILSNGFRYRDATYKATEHIRVQLICISPNLNPVYVLLDQVDEIEQAEQ